MKMNRRDFLESASMGTAATATMGLSARRPVQVRRPSPEIDALYDRSIIVDSLTNQEWDDAGFAAWRESGYTAIQTSLASRDFEVGMRALEEWRERIRQRSDVFIDCTRAADIERAKREGKLAVIRGFQNATVIGNDVDNLDRLYEAGTRFIQLTYNSRNLLGDGCTERLVSGLSDFGVDCVEKMNELGILVDLSHCGEGTTSDGIAFSSRPPAFTHTMCKALHYHPRAKSDSHLRALGERGGMVGIVALGYFVGPTADASLDDYVDHIDHAVNVCGIEHVGLCTDFAIRGIEATATRESWYVPRLTRFKPSYNVRWPPWVEGLDKPDRFRNVAQVLADRGYASSDVERILGGNWVRYFRDIFGE
jgi:membrane dipeptidase